MRLKFFVVLFLSLLFNTQVKGQNFAVKSNILYDATATINFGMEIGLAPQWTFDLSGNFNGWKMSDDRMWKHWMLQPEARYWFCERFGGHFVGVHAHGGQFNFGGIDNNFSFLGTDFSKLSDQRYQGWFVGGGVGYGYSWILNKSWNLEAELGVGYSYTRYDSFPCAPCGEKLEENMTHHYIGVTKLAVSLIYLF